MDSPANPSTIKQGEPDSSPVVNPVVQQEMKDEEISDVVTPEPIELQELGEEPEEVEELVVAPAIQTPWQPPPYPSDQVPVTAAMTTTLEPDIEVEALPDNPVLGVPPAAKSVIRKQVRQKSRPGGIYTQSVITRRITLGIENVGRSLKENLEKIVASDIEGKCIVEGFIKPNSTRLLTYNSGVIKNGRIVFEVVFECLSCCPVEGMLIDCIAKNITKAGIRAELDDSVSPVVIFIARDHNHLSDYFNSITENDNIKVRVIGQRFELNDKYVSVIAEIVEQKEVMPQKRKTKPRLIIPKGD